MPMTTTRRHRSTRGGAASSTPVAPQPAVLSPQAADGDVDALASLLDLTNRTQLPGGVLSGLAKIGPVEAGLLLEMNTRNRHINPDHVSMLARAMSGEQWMFNGSPLIIGPGVILDGQHRLLAVQKSNTVQQFLVLLGLPLDVQAVIDTNRKRSAGDALAIAGVANSANAASMIRLLLAWGAGQVTHASYTAGNVEVVAFVEDYTDQVADSVNVSLRARGNGLPISTAAVSALHFRLSTMPDVAPEDIAAFFDRVCQGVDLYEGAPELALRKLMMRRNRDGVRTNRVEALYYIVRAWNARMQGEDLAKLQLPRGGLKADTFPAPLPSAALNAEAASA